VATPVHFYVSFRGIFKSTPEAWSFGLRFSRDNPAGGDANMDDIDVENMGDALKVFMQNTQSAFPDSAQFTEVRGYLIGPDGKMQGNPEIVDFTSQNVVGATANKYPPQVCLVATHVALNRGPGRYGRAYIPTAATIGTDMRVTVGVAGAFLSAYTTFVKAVSNEIDLELTQSSEQLNISRVGAGGARQTVDHHEVGRRLDTLRSRNRSMVEERLPGGHIDW